MQQFQAIEAPSAACWFSSICSQGFSVQQAGEVIASPAQSARKCSSAVPSSVAPAVDRCSSWAKVGMVSTRASPGLTAS